ncbi:MAG TPA: DNA helicase II [Candidatus Acidoferrales bacterium]|nr:DNA helicase II [Candidatus Acidoferrales bacterium]
MTDVTALLEGLNGAQREAVCAPAGAVLVLAGAGSGKTRVLVHRAAWLMTVEGVSPYGILAVTFTNKAAGEMRARLQRWVNLPAGTLWIGTFHGLSHRLLRQHAREAGLPEGFQILDSDDQRRLIKRVLRNLELDETRWPPRQCQAFINAQKEEGLRARDVAAGNDPAHGQMLRIYEAYEEACERAGLLDFAELLLRSFELLQRNPTLLAHYRQRFGHVLVDEFQDTNALQYRWLRQLAGAHGQLFVVGDDDQSIYGWRGARADHLQRFLNDYPQAQVIRLEQNYRSTATILEAANALIAHNSDRLGKTLWTEGARGEPIRCYRAFNERDEADFVVETLKSLVAAGTPRREMAVLYRSNAQSRVLEEALIQARMPYRVYGGLRFFERAEIKDALAYLRLTQNRDDDAAFERVVNTPPRGIGVRTLESLRQEARAGGLTLWQAASRFSGSRTAAALGGFLQQIDALARAIDGLPLGDQVAEVIQRSGLMAHHGAEKGEQGQGRQENLQELVRAASGFTIDPDAGLSPLTEFLTHAALEAGEMQAASGEDGIQLMTLHAAKGLEFKVVFITGLEEGLFPHQRALEDASGLAEERRLCYVGMTRAMQTLYLSHAEKRRLYQSEQYTIPSRFLDEIPPECIEAVRPRVEVSRPISFSAPLPGAASGGFRLGQSVRHARFGEGVVLAFEGAGEAARVHVNFRSAGPKWLITSFAKLEAV